MESNGFEIGYNKDGNLYTVCNRCRIYQTGLPIVNCCTESTRVIRGLTIIGFTQTGLLLKSN